MHQFKDKAFEHRFKMMGDLAEQAFETTFKKVSYVTVLIDRH